MKSIKIKLLVGILLILSILLAGIITYGFTFKSYFQSEKLKEMKLAINEITVKIENSDINKVATEIEMLLAQYNLQLDIEDTASGKIIYASHKNGKNNSMNGMGGQNRFETVKEFGSQDGLINQQVHDKATGINFLSSTQLSKGGVYTLIVKTPISEISDASKKSMNLLTIILLPITFIVIIITIIFSNQFTKPIIAINRKTSKIEKLDFNDELKITSKDEIGNLAHSVNNLSKTIERTLEDLKDKNLSLEEMIQKERANEIIRREFVSSVSHELKSPIAVISGYVQMLNEGIITSEEDKKYYLSVINEESDRMKVIVNDLLDLYKLESNTFKLEVSEVDLSILLKKIIKKNSFRFDELGIKVISNIDSAMVIGDEIRLEQAIQNYINNALSHIDDTKILKIDVNASGVITVFNSGKLIEEENLEKIWQGFVRIDKVRNYKEKRVGLGLAIVRQIVSLHHGECGVVNKETGVEFWIKLKIT